MELLEFAKNNWLLLLIGVLVLVLLVRAMFKIAFMVAIVGVILVVVFDYTPAQVWLLGKSAVSETTQLYEATIQPVLEDELTEATYAIYPDGRFAIQTKNVTIEGTEQSEEVTVRYKEKEFIIPIALLGKQVEEHIKMAKSQLTTTN